MAGSVNKVILVGRLGKDPEVRRTQSGSPVVSFSLATSERWRDKRSGDMTEKSQWHQIVIWNENLCKIAEDYLHKGSLVYLEGTLETRSWEDDKNDVTRYVTEVILKGFDSKLTMLESAGEHEGGSKSSRGRDDDDRGSRRSDRGSDRSERGRDSSGDRSDDRDNRRDRDSGSGRSGKTSRSSQTTSELLDDDIPF